MSFNNSLKTLSQRHGLLHCYYKMVDAIECTLLEEGVEVKEYICKLSRKLQEGVDNSRLAQETRTEGASVLSAACLVCQRVFTLTKAGLVQTHGPVDCCSGSRAPPASNSGASLSLDKVQQGPPSPVQGEEEDLQRLPNICREYPERIPCGLREVEVRKMGSVVEAAVTKRTKPPGIASCISPPAASVLVRGEAVVGTWSEK